MSVHLTALFAAALHQTRAIDADPVGTDRALDLLVLATAGEAAVFELDGDRLLVNDIPMSGDAPGALLVRTALLEHDTSVLRLPPQLTTRQWGEVAELFASAPGLFPSADHVRESLVTSVPGATLLAYGRPSMSDELRAALFDIPDTETDLMPTAVGSTAMSRGADRAELSQRLDPLLAEGFAAVEAQAWERTAEVLLSFRALEDASDSAARTIIARERRRVAPTHILDILVRLLPKHETAPVIRRALFSLGPDGANALIEALNGAPGRAERRAYIEALVASPNAEDAILTAMTSYRPALARDAAEAAGHRRMERAIPQLSAMLKHADQEVRSGAWHALEEIGTREALEALKHRK